MKFCWAQTFYTNRSTAQKPCFLRCGWGYGYTFGPQACLTESYAKRQGSPVFLHPTYLADAAPGRKSYRTCIPKVSVSDVCFHARHDRGAVWQQFCSQPMYSWLTRLLIRSATRHQPLYRRNTLNLPFLNRSPVLGVHGFELEAIFPF